MTEYNWICPYCDYRYNKNEEGWERRAADHIDRCDKKPSEPSLETRRADPLPRYALQFDEGNTDVRPDPNGYWTPWHLAERALAEVTRERDERELELKARQAFCCQLHVIAHEVSEGCLVCMAQEAAFHAWGVKREVEARAEAAEASLTVAQAIAAEMRAEVLRIAKDYDKHTVPSATVYQWVQQLEAAPRREDDNR